MTLNQLIQSTVEHLCNHRSDDVKERAANKLREKVRKLYPETRWDWHIGWLKDDKRLFESHDNFRIRCAGTVVMQVKELCFACIKEIDQEDVEAAELAAWHAMSTSDQLKVIADGLKVCRADVKRKYSAGGPP